MALSDFGTSALLVATVVAALAGVLCVELWLFRPAPAEAHFCDRQVAILLDSRDPLEVQRAGILVHEIPCDILRRIVARSP